MFLKHNANIMIINKHSCANETIAGSFTASSTEKRMEKYSKRWQLVNDFLNLQINHVKNKTILDYFLLKFRFNSFFQQFQIIFHKLFFIKSSLL